MCHLVCEHTRTRTHRARDDAEGLVYHKKRDTGITDQSVHVQETVTNATTFSYNMTCLAASTETGVLTPSYYRGSTKSFLFGPVQEAGGGRRGQPGKTRLQKQSHQLLSAAGSSAQLRCCSLKPPGRGGHMRPSCGRDTGQSYLWEQEQQPLPLNHSTGPLILLPRRLCSQDYGSSGNIILYPKLQFKT